jgi:ankyrin repeat protein
LLDKPNSMLGASGNVEALEEGGTSNVPEEADAVESLRRSLRWSDRDDAAGERSGWTLLKFAVLSDDVAAVKALICSAAKGANRGAAGIDQPLVAHGPVLCVLPKFTNLHLAMMLASPPMVKLLIDSSADATAVDSLLGSTPLHTGCANGRSDNVKCFLDTLPNYDVDIRALHGGQTALHWSAYLAPYPKQRSLMRMLVGRGASPFLKTIHGRTLLHSVALAEDCDATLIPEVLAWYATFQPETQRPGVDSRQIPITLRWTALCKFFYWRWRLGNRSNLSKFFAINYKATPLHLAIFRNDHEAVSFLIEAGADPGVVNASGNDAAALSQVLWGSTDLQELTLAKHPRVPKSGAVYSSKLASQATRQPSGWFGEWRRWRPNTLQVAPAPGAVGT